MTWYDIKTIQIKEEMKMKRILFSSLLAMVMLSMPLC